MIRVTLCSTWITRVMFMVSRSGARLPTREAVLKKCIHITRIGLPGRLQKHTVRCVLSKKGFCRNPSHNPLSAIARMTPSLPQRGRQPKGACPPFDPQFRSFFRCVFTAILHGTRVDRPRAPVAPSLSNTVPYRFSPEPKNERDCKTSAPEFQDVKSNNSVNNIQKINRMIHSLPGAPPPPPGHPRWVIVLGYLFRGYHNTPRPPRDWWRKGGTIVTNDVTVISSGGADYG